nr:MAG TPA: Protein VMS1,Vms1,Protein VMS1,Vms1, Eukaryotic translation ribosomal subunit, Vms1, Tif6.4A [Caudoviricetes sp.]
MYIFRAWITRKDGTRDYAKDHGKRAFRIWIDPEALNQKKKKIGN